MKGTPNKSSGEVREIARNLVNDPQYLASLKIRLEEGKASNIEPTLWAYAYGKPKEAPESLRHEVRVMFGGRYKDDDSEAGQ